MTGDAARLAALSGELGYPADISTMAARLETILGRGGEVVYVAELPGPGVIGWIHGIEETFLESGRRCEIAGLVVGMAHRARGIGRLLVGAVEAWAATRGIDQMSVRSNIARVESHPFYERVGYRRIKTQHAYRKGLLLPPA